MPFTFYMKPVSYYIPLKFCLFPLPHILILHLLRDVSVLIGPAGIHGIVHCCLNLLALFKPIPAPCCIYATFSDTTVKEIVS